MITLAHRFVSSLFLQNGFLLSSLRTDGRQILVWIGDKGDPMLQNMHYAVGAGGGKGDAPVTALFGSRFHNLGEKLAQRLCTKLGVPCVCSWNVRHGAGAAQEETDLLANLLLKEIAAKHEHHAAASLQQPAA